MKTTRTHKRCPKCELDLPVSNYGLRANGKWLRSYCRPCESKTQLAFQTENPAEPETYWRQHLQRKYKMTVEDYDDLLEEQEGKCGICGTTDPGTSKTRFSVDHDHRTRKVRGLLCSKCNIALGGLGDTIERLEKAVAYLKAAQ